MVVVFVDLKKSFAKLLFPKRFNQPSMRLDNLGYIMPIILKNSTERKKFDWNCFLTVINPESDESTLM